MMPTPRITDQDTIPFGKFKGRYLRDLPDWYLVWLYGQEWCKKDYPGLFDYVVRNADLLPDLDLRQEDR